ncbi:hypothetical protein JKP88DRAFT_245996 [Tribonema minus]|uniref:Uncharacterized protein n=1 Tax=Tribonema minus TaxID=303371 RepID=A0A836CDN6_9STRA|nr:hypothetical protein JKP88DRAFT_245996 [Tribonema minus]
MQPLWYETASSQWCTPPLLNLKQPCSVHGLSRLHLREGAHSRSTSMRHGVAQGGHVPVDSQPFDVDSHWRSARRQNAPVVSVGDDGKDRAGRNGGCPVPKIGHGANSRLTECLQATAVAEQQIHAVSLMRPPTFGACCIRWLRSQQNEPPPFSPPPPHTFPTLQDTVPTRLTGCLQATALAEQQIRDYLLVRPPNFGAFRVRWLRSQQDAPPRHCSSGRLLSASFFDRCRICEW